jgi:ATP-binding cassette subfamily B protein
LTTVASETRGNAPGTQRFWAQVWSLARPWWGRLTVIAVCVVGAAVAGIVPPLVVRQVVNADLVPRRTAGLPSAGLAYLGAVAVGAALVYAYSYLAAIVAQRVIVAIRVRLFSHLSSLPVSYLDRTPVGDTISRATADVETIDTLFTDGVTTLVGQAVSIVAIAVAMIVVSPLLSLVSLLVLPPLVLASRWLQVRIRDAERATRIAVGELNTQLSETVGGTETIRAFHREEAFIVRFRMALHRTLVAQESSVRYNAFFTPVTALLSSTVIGLLLFVGARGAFGTAGVNLGTLVGFVMLFQGFFAPIVALGDQWNAVQAALAGAERVFEVLDLPVEPSPQGSREDGRAGVVVDNVSFGYHRGLHVLHDLSLVVHPGERVAIVGRTGSGKSTLLALAVGSYEPDAGTVLLAGRHPRDFDEHERRQVVGVVPQRVQLFSGTLRENVTLGDEAISDDAVMTTMTLVGLDALVGALPQGLDAELAGAGGGAGLTLSAGQRQLVALARALVAEPQVLLLDEATAAVDAHSEASFRAALSRTTWSKGCAVVMVAHRISTARDADRVIVMEAGRIVEEGAPGDLVATGGRFAALAALDEAGWSWEE